MTKKKVAQYAHQRVLDFTFSCDNKASFLLTFIGVVLTVIMTTEQFMCTFSLIIESLKSYLVENEDMVLTGEMCTEASAVAFYVLFAIALYYLFFDHKYQF